MCYDMTGELHVDSEMSQKRNKGIKTWKITYSVILSVLSNKTNFSYISEKPPQNPVAPKGKIRV